MKKFIGLFLAFSSLMLVFVGCGDKTYEPKGLAQYGEIYRDTNNQEPDGQYPVINITNIEKEEDNIIIKIGAPTKEQVKYAFNNYFFVEVLDEKGVTLTINKLLFNVDDLDTDIECEIRVLGVQDIDKAKYIRVGPYKTENRDIIEFNLD